MHFFAAKETEKNKSEKNVYLSVDDRLLRIRLIYKVLTYIR